MNTSLSLSDINSNTQSKATTKEVLLKYLIYFPLFIITLGVSLGLAYLYVKYKTPVYSSSISVFFPEGNKGAGGSNSGSEMSSGINELMLFSKKVNLANEIEVLKTKTLMTRVIRKLNLNLQYFKKGKIKKSELYNTSLVKASVIGIKDSSKGESVEIIKNGAQLYTFNNKEKKPITAKSIIKGTNVSFDVSVDTTGLKENDRYIISWEPVMSVADMLTRELVIAQPQRDANILNISVDTEVPEKGADLLNTLVQEYNLSNNEKKNKLVDYTLSFIDERIGLMRGELGKVESSIQSYRQANEIVDPGAQNTAGFEQMSTAKSQIDNSEVKLQVINMVKQSVANPDQPIPTTLGIDDPTLSSLVKQYNDNIFKKAEQLKEMPAANPAVRSTESQIEKLKSSIYNNLENINVSTSQLKQRYLGEFQANRARLNAVPRQERQLMEIGRQQDIKEKLFMFLLQKKEEAAITKASQLSSNSSALDPSTSSGLLSPSAPFVYRLAIALGLFIPVLIIYLRELLNDKIITRNDITGKTNTPVIGEISHYSQKKRRLVVGFDDRTVVGEQFRMVRANIPFLTKSQDKKVLLVTSTTPAEGKTFCSLNLAAVFAIAGKKTVIVEMDLRKPKVGISLKMPDTAKGITHYISGQATFEELPIAIPDFENLYVVTAGVIPPNPSEILMDEKIEALFTYLKANFDCVVIDSAPLGLVSDAKILAKHADATIYLVRQRITPKKQLTQLNELYESEVFPNLSVLVNDVKASGAYSYYGYGSNYMSTYNYSYGHESVSIWQKAKAAIGL
ncbi:MAG: polysaccharide biosynthesis tyrosine autokinase [Segetibacter sp.]